MKIKICGLTNYNDAASAAKMGADYLGFIFAKSPRQVTSKKVSDIIYRLQKDNILTDAKVVGVFVNEPVESINEIVKECGLDMIQLHGDETFENAKNISVDWYKAYRIGSKADIYKMIKKWDIKRYLIDPKVVGVYGGTGKSVDINLAILSKNEVNKREREFFLAGGLNPDNLLGIIKRVKPDGIDLSSGIEREPGKKDIVKMQKIFDLVGEYNGKK